MRTGVLATVAAVFALVPAAASAADLYANPNGTSNGACGQADPCDIVSAVGDATKGDTVIVEPGTYTPTMTVDDGGAGGPITIEGEPGVARPVIDSSASYGIEILEGSTVSDLDVIDHEGDSWGIYVANNPGNVDHVYVQTDGTPSGACYIDGSLTDSVCWANGPTGVGAAAIEAGPVTANLRNDTIEATGSGGYGVSAYMGSGTETLNLTNTIIHGAGADIYGEAEPGASATVTAAYSNFATVDNNGGGGTVSLPAAGSATNQTAAPVFAQAGAGDFHELSSSPTIGAGADSALNGTTDLDGNPREIDGNTDIGAYEFVPAPTCEPSKALVHANKPGPVSLHCTDLAGAPLTYAIVTKPAHGTLSTPSSGGTATYTPAKGYSGLDRFTFEATSSHGTSAAQTALITVLLPPPGLSKVKLRGTTLGFTLNEPASVTLTFARRGHKNVIVRLKGKAGKNSYKIKKLKAGKYKLTIAAQNGGGRAKSKSISLKIKR